MTVIYYNKITRFLIMKKYKALLISAGILVGFVVYTLLIKFVDVQVIGPNSSSVGFATLNGWFHTTVGEHMTLYKITDWASIVAIPVGFVFALIGLLQLIKRKSLLKVDSNILALGVFYILVFAAYALFEVVVVNRRPVLIEGILEASYPSSTTVLALTIFTTAIDQINIYIKNDKLKKGLSVAISSFSLFLVIGRIISGVHWITDIIGGVILSAGLVACYFGLKDLFTKPEKAE